MRQGDGSDLLGPGDPRNAEIGIIYVEAGDARQDILTAITARDLAGCKQIAIVLLGQSKVFRQPVDFDGLKNMRTKQLKNADLVFIAPSGSPPAEFARQRRFVVYSTLENYQIALQHEDSPSSGRRMKSNPGKEPGLLGFGSRKARPDAIRGPQGRGKPSGPVSPTPDFDQDDQPMLPVPIIPISPLADLPTVQLDQAGKASAGLESEDDALYAPPGSQPAQPVEQSQTPPDHRSGPTPGIIAFPPVPTTPKTSGKFPAIQPSSQGLSPRSAGKTSRGLGKNSGQMPPAPGSGKLPVAPPVPDASTGNGGATPGSGKLPAAQKQSGNTGNVAAVAAGAAGVVIGASLAADSAGGKSASGTLGTKPANAAAGGAGPNLVAAGGAGGSGMGPRPSGLTSLPPPRSYRQPSRGRFRWRLLLAGLLVLLSIFLIVAVVYGKQGSGGMVNPFQTTISAQVIVTPANKLEQDNFILAALPKGTPIASQRQIQARNPSVISATQTATGHATGDIPATQAQGILTFTNNTDPARDVTLGNTTLTGNDGVKVEFSGPVVVPASGSFSANATAFAVNPGSQGDIGKFDINMPCCVPGITVRNAAAFTDGQDAKPNSKVVQSDIDSAAKPLESSLTQSTQTSLAQKVEQNERVVTNSFQCTPTANSDHNAGDLVSSFTVSVSVACSEEVYDYTGALAMGSDLLKAEAQTDPALNAQYALDGQITTGVLSAVAVSSGGQISVTVEARGLWVYQFTTQMEQNLKLHLVKISKAEAQTFLLHETGVANAQITLSSGDTMPADVSGITLTVQTLPGAQPIPTGTSGSPVTNPTPTSPGSQATPTQLPGMGS